MKISIRCFHWFLAGSILAFGLGEAKALTVSLPTDTLPVSIPGELRYAIANTPSGGTVDFAPGLAGLTIILAPANGSFAVNQDLTIDGSNAPGLVIDGAGSASVFTVGSPASSVTFHRLTIRNGSAFNGGGIYIAAPCTVTVSESTIESNVVTGRGGGIYAWMGGRLDVRGCLIANNTSGSQGGGIYTVTHCTFSGNAAGPVANGTSIDGIFSSIPFHLVNTIIASGRGNVDCYIIALTPLATNINNLIADGSCSPMLAAPPLLGPLTANGGPTRTLALLPGSPCLNAAAGASSNDPGLNGVPGGGDDLALTTDQRGAGFVRTAGGSPDIGAFELRIQPDIVIGKTANPAAGLGNDRYNNSGAGQTLKLVSKRASLLRATFWIGNDGDLPDAIGLRGTRGNNLFRITYSDAGKNITSAVTGGTHATAVLAPGQTSAVSILVKPDRRKLQTRSAGAKVTWLKRRLNLILTCTSQNDPARQDVAKISVKHL